MSRNVTIPLSLFNNIIDLIDCWDVSDYDPLLRPTYSDVLFALTKKKQSIELRNAYAKIIYADSEQEQHDARMRYLMKKRESDNFF
jgi:hypothetical protein